MNYEYLLPIGSVVQVQGFKQHMMIFGVLQQSAGDPGRQYDYVAVPHPLGNTDPRMRIGFNHADIEEVLFRGYEDDQWKAYVALLSHMSQSRPTEAAEAFR